MRYTPRSELDARLARLQKLLVANEIDCVLVRHNPNLFYFAGTMQNAHLFIPAAGEPLLLVRRDFMRGRLESQLDRVLPLQSLKQLPQLLREHHVGFGRLGLELDVLPAGQYIGYQQLFNNVELVDAAPLLREVRTIKSAYEVARIEEAADQVDEMFRTARDRLREGITEIELSVEVEKVARLGGHQGIVRTRAWGSEVAFGHLLAGPSAALANHLDATAGGVGMSPALGQSAGYRRIKRGEPVLFDVTGWVDGYLADQTRTLVIGPAPQIVRDAYEAMRGIYSRLREAARPGVLACDVYDLALKLAAETDFADYFMGPKSARAAFVGHGVGLELDEPPPLARGITTPLAEGMVIAIEPKAIIPGVGTIGFENSHLVTADGLRALTFSEEDLAVV